MAAEADTLLNEARCLGCASNASTAEMLKLALWQRLTNVDEIVDSFVERSGLGDSTQIAAISQLVLSARVHGWWNKCDLIYPFVGGTAGAHAENLKSADFTITWNGTVTHDANGITGDGATGYGDTSFIPSTAEIYGSNNGHVSVYRRTIGTQATNRYYVAVSQGTRGLGIRNGTGTNIGGTTQASVTGGPEVASSALRLIMHSRNSGPTRLSYTADGEFSVSKASTAVSTGPVFVLARNIVGVGAGSFGDMNIAGLTLGSHVSHAEYQRMAADWQVFETVLGRAV